MVLAHTHHLIPSFRIPPQKAKHWLVLGYRCRDYQTRILLQNPGRWKKQRNSTPRIKLDTTLNDENG
jgi:hypothetical protein